MRAAQAAIEREAAAAAATAAAGAVPATPAAQKYNPEDNYDISSIASSDKTDDEEHPKRPVPLWARGPALKVALNNQVISQIDPFSIFPALSPPNLTRIFDNKNKPR